ncbi:MAG: OmpA family protein [Bacteroidetes bacterium]|nr:OmpA family protein [Bacteroidota bacterium]
MKKSFLLSVAFILILGTCLAQPTKRAQKKMNLYNYSLAIKILEKAVKKPKYHDAAIPMLAECYRMQRDVENTKKWYGEAITLPSPKPEFFYYYAKALFASSDYNKAMELFSRYEQLNPSDKRAKLNEEQCKTLLNDWKNRVPGYEVKAIPHVNSPESDFGPAFFGNGFTFSSDRGKDYMEEESYGWTGRRYLKLYFSKPLDPGNFFGDFRKPNLMSGRFNEVFHNGPVCFINDSFAFLTKSSRDKNAPKVQRVKTDYLKIYTMSKVLGDWEKAVPFPLNSYEYSVGHPALSPDGNTLYFASDMPGGQGGVDLWMCKREADAWSKPINLGPAINTVDNEMFPSVRMDNTLFFASDGLPGYGGLDIFSTRIVNNEFSTPRNLMSPINTSYDDFAIAWIPGTTYGLFSSDRPGGMGSDDLYAFRKLPEQPPLVECKKPINLSGLVIDKTSGKPLPGATVFVLNEINDSVIILKTDADGLYHLTLKTAVSIIVKASRTNFIPDCLAWTVENQLEGKDNKAPRDLVLSELEVNKTFKLENIYYDFDKYDIRPDAEPALDNLVHIMKDNPITIELGSHTDCRGSFEYNDKLSLRRAESATNYLVEHGIEAARISSKGYGEHQLVNHCSDGVACSPAEHQANRRTEFKIISYISQQPETGKFNPESFKTGSSVLRDTLPADFFMQCK